MATHEHDREQHREGPAERPATADTPRSGLLASAMSWPRRQPLAAGGIMGAAVLTLLIGFMTTPTEPPFEDLQSDYGPVPEFAAIDHIPDRKAAFFAFLQPMIEDQNEWILENRRFLQSLRAELIADVTPEAQDQQRVEALAKRYGVSLADGITVDVVDELLHHGDVIPPSLVLAQAAKESGWGMSRFARDGNNYFGEWCYTEGCGIVPARRGPGQQHEVEAFDSVEDGVDSYFRNLNRGGPYQQVRVIRAESRDLGRPLSSTRLAAGLQKYSERGQVYVDEVRSLIAYNNLTAFDSELLSRAESSASRDSG